MERKNKKSRGKPTQELANTFHNNSQNFKYLARFFMWQIRNLKNSSETKTKAPSITSNPV